eukprot:jgi/Mesvir1/28612/Mv01027-RA.1
MLGCLYCFCLACQVISHIASKQMSSKTREVLNMYLKVLEDFYPERSTVESASIWVDYLKARGVDLFDDWHYMNMPVANAGNQVTRMETHPELTLPGRKKVDMVAALEGAAKALHDPNSDGWVRAVMVRVVLNLVGDLHQPLHLSYLVSPALPLEKGGDRWGGRLPLDKVSQALVPNILTLHDFWESGCGLFNDMRMSRASQSVFGGVGVDSNDVDVAAQVLMDSFPPASFPIRRVVDRNFTAWSLEVQDFVRSAVYTGSVLSSLASNEKGPISLDTSYAFQAQGLVQELIPLAGYRMAALLDDLLLNTLPAVLPETRRAATPCADAPPAPLVGENDIVLSTKAAVVSLAAGMLLLVWAVGATCGWYRERHRWRRGYGAAVMADMELQSAAFSTALDDEDDVFEYK